MVTGKMTVWQESSWGMWLTLMPSCLPHFRRGCGFPLKHQQNSQSRESVRAIYLAVARANQFPPPTMGSFLNLDAILNGVNEDNKTTSKQDDDSAVTKVTGGKTKQKDAEMKQLCCQLVLNGNDGGLLKDAALNVATLFKIILADFPGQVSVFDHNGKEHTSIDEKRWKSNIEFQQSFQIDTKSWGAPNDRKEERVMSFNVKSSVSLDTIKHGSRVCKMLSSNSVFLCHDPFDDVKINSHRPIGHFNMIDPSVAAEQVKDMLGQALFKISLNSCDH
jgi:hypothetical protein